MIKELEAFEIGKEICDKDQRVKNFIQAEVTDPVAQYGRYIRQIDRDRGAQHHILNDRCLQGGDRRTGADLAQVFKRDRGCGPVGKRRDCCIEDRAIRVREPQVSTNSEDIA